MPEPTLWVLKAVYSTPENSALTYTSLVNVKAFSFE